MIALLAASLLSAPLLAASVRAPSQDAALEMHPVEVRVAGGTKTAYRGMLRVPIVRARPDSKPIGIDVWHFPAEPEVDAQRLPLFRLFGGPGWGGYTPDSIDWEDDIAPFVAQGDLVVVGQRGIGQSDPHTSCDAFSSAPEGELSPAEWSAAVREQCAACRAHWEAQGYDLTGFNVIEAAADVDDVRRLLGFDKILLSGGSYGSHWAMTVLRQHPDIVERALLHGMEGPNHTYDSPSGVLGALERIAAEAEASGALGGRVPEDGLIEGLRFVIDSIEGDPFEIDVDGELVPITAEGLRGLALGVRHSVRSRRSVGGWPSDVIRLYEGEFEDAARALRGGEGGGLPTASFFQLDCGSGITRERLERLQSDPATAIVGDLSRFYEAACPAWDADLGDDFRADFTTAVPTLVVHGTWDVSTPFDNALELLHCFEQLHFVRVEGGTHGALGEALRHDADFLSAVDAFLYEGDASGLPDAVELPPIEWDAPR